MKLALALMVVFATGTLHAGSTADCPLRNKSSLFKPTKASLRKSASQVSTGAIGDEKQEGRR